MRQYFRHLYAKNLASKGIVYDFADELSITITKKDFLKLVPEATEADFKKLKKWSDSDYKNLERQDTDEAKNTSSIDETKNATLSRVLYGEWLAYKASEEYVRAEEEKFQQLLAESEAIIEKLTPTQRRRYLMYHVEELTLMQIADREKVKFQSVHESLESAREKIAELKSKLRNFGQDEQ